MAKYIDADRLRAEVERRLDELNPKTGMFGDRPLRAVNPRTFPRESELEKVLYLIDSLQQEQPEVDLEKEIVRFLSNSTKINKGACRGKYAISDIGFRAVARHFCELGQRKAAEMYDEIEYNRQRSEEEMLGKTLDEAAEEYLKQYNESEFGNGGDDWDDDIIITFKSGAKWMSGLGKIFDGEVISTSDNNWECIRIYEKIHSVGDKVIVQIRKK